MDPSTVIDGIREYTGNGYGVHMDSLIIAQSTIYDIVGFVLGLLAFFISIGMFLITALDVCYITIPIFQDKVRSQRWDGSRGSKVRFISKDAVEAVELAYTIDNGSAIGSYLKKRVKTYIICGVILYIILIGSNTLVPIIANIVLSILRALSNIHIVE